MRPSQHHSTSLASLFACLFLSAASVLATNYSQLQGTFLPPVTPAAGYFGQSVAMDGDYVVVGGPKVKAGAVVVYRISTGAKVATFVNPVASSTDQFGAAVAISGNRVAVGAPYNGTAAASAGSVYLFDLGSATPATAVLTLRDPAAASENFGASVALSGSRLVVGAPYATFAGKVSGAAYVYELAGSSPGTSTLTLNTPDPMPVAGEGFGSCLAVEGNHVVVGTSNYHRAYLFDLQSASPSSATLTFSDPGSGSSNFGASVALSGSRVVIGAYTSDSGATSAGTVYAYDLSGAAPNTPTVTLAPAAPASYLYFGQAISLSGSRLAVGCSGAAPNSGGNVTVYDLAGSSPAAAVFTIANPTPASGDGFGNAVALLGDHLAVGAPWDDAGTKDAGAAYLFDLVGAQPSTPVATYTDPTTAVYDRFGRAVAMSGHYMVVGAYGNAGAVYLYDLTSDTPGVPFATLQNPGNSGNNFGRSVAISTTSSSPRVVVGAELEYGGSQGAVYTYLIGENNAVSAPTRISNPKGFSNDNFGYSVAVDSSFIYVGAYNESSGGTKAGAAYLFDLSALPSNTAPRFTLHGGGSYAEFGTSVASDGRVLIVGAPFASVGGTYTGAAYLYNVQANLDTVGPFATLQRPTPQSNCDFGESVAISGSHAVVGASEDDASTTGGAAYVFNVNYTYNDSFSTPYGASLWLTVKNPNPSANDSFGFPVALDSGIVVVGASLRDQGASNAGGAYAFVLNGLKGRADLSATYLKPTPASGDRYGFAAAIAGNRVAIGALYDDTVDLDEGAVYVYGDPLGKPAFPDIALEMPEGTPLPSTAVDFGVVVPAMHGAKTFTIRNTGNAALTNFSTLFTGADNASFAVTTAPQASVAPAGTTSFTVTFTPSSPGDKTASLVLYSNDPDESPYPIPLKGVGNHPPTLTLPQPFTVFASSDSGGNVAFTATASDAEDGSLVPTTTPASGALFPVGDTTVNASVTDANGVTTTGSFAVKVLPPPADLGVSQLAVAPASGLRSGDTVTLNWQDLNSGIGFARGGWFDTLNVTRTSDNSVLYATSIYHDPSTEGDLAPNAKLSRQATFKLPDGVTGAGAFHCAVTTDATSLVAEDNPAHTAETNNAATADFTSALKPYPDLQVQNLAVTPASPNSGTTVDVRWNTKNIGNAAAPVAFSDRLVVRNLDHDEVLYDGSVGGEVNVPLASGQVRARLARVPLPQGPRGAGALTFTVAADNGNAIAEYNADDTGEANNVAAANAQSTLVPFADLVVTGITVPAQATPGQLIDLIWTIKNQGNADAPAGWIDRVFASPDNQVGDDSLLASTLPAAALAAGQSVEHRATIALPLLRAGAEYIVVRTNAGNDTFEGDLTNNTAVSTQAMTVPITLRLDLGRTSVKENQGGFDATVARNGDNSQALTVTLQATPAALLVLPASVTIAAHEDKVTFTVAPLDNQALNPTQHVAIIASAASYADATAPLDILDDDVPALTISLSTSTVVESAANPAVTGTVTRNTGTGAALAIALVSSQPTAASSPASVVIPAGTLSATFPITVYDDKVLTSARTVRFTASASGLTAASAVLTVTDDDIPGISLRLSPTSVSENAPSPAASGRIVRDRTSDRAVIFQVASSDPTQVKVPATVTLSPGATVVDFPINVIDNDVADGPRGVLITVTETDSVLHHPIDLQRDQQTLKILDNEGPTLALSASSATVVPAHAITGTVTRPAGSSGVLSVTLASNSPAITIPASIQIGAGAQTATFPITAASGLTASVPVTITASASGLNSASVGVTALSGAQADLAMASVVPSTLSVRGGDPVAVTFEVENDGSAVATGNWSDTVYLTIDRQSATGSSSATIAAGGPLDPGTGYSHTAHLAAPTAPGLYWAVATANVLNSFPEGSLTNNTLISAQPIQVSAAYRVTVATSISLAHSGSTVPLSGQALSTLDSSPVPQAPVSVRVLVNGTRRVYQAITDSYGNYLINFNSLATEAGHYSVAAALPEVTDDAIQARFELVGIGTTPTSLTVGLAVQQPISGDLPITNLSDHPLSGLTASLVSAAPNITATLTPPTILPANGAGVLHYSFTAADDTIQRARVTIHLTSAEGTVTDVPVNLTVLPAAAQLVTDPGTLSRGMLVGASTLVDFDLVNLGAAPTGDLTLDLPTIFPWLSLVSPAVVPSLAPGARARVTLNLQPSATLALQLYTGTIVARAAQSALTIPFQFRAISQAVGDLRVSVADDYTYYTPNSPLVSDATVLLRDAYDQSIIVAQGLTDATGTVTLGDVPAGPYFLEVSATKHGTYRNGFTVQPGVLNQKSVFIPRETITYSWQVVPTEVPDRYEIKLVSTFEVDVPVPVVTMDLTPSTIPDLADGESLQIDMRLENHGLIAAQDIRFHFPGLESGYQFTPLITQLDQIEAKSSVTIPVVVRRAVAGVVSAAHPERRLFAGDGGGGGDGTPCIDLVSADYSYDCADQKRTNTASQGIAFEGRICGHGPLEGGGGGGFTLPRLAGSGTLRTFSVSIDTECNPCADLYLKAALDCLSGFIPVAAGLKNAVACGYGLPNCANDLYNAYIAKGHHGLSPAKGYGCGRTLQACLKGAGEESPLAPILGFVDCAVSFYDAYSECKERTEGGPTTKSRKVARFAVARTAEGAASVAAAPPQYNPADFPRLAEALARMNDELTAAAYVFGDPVWLRSESDPNWGPWMDAFLAATADESDGGSRVTPNEQTSLLGLPRPLGITPDIATALIARNNRTVDYYNQEIYTTDAVPAGGSLDFFALDVASQNADRARQADLLSRAEGFDSTVSGLVGAVQQLTEQAPPKTQGVCAQVKIEIDQQAVLTRNAFSGTLEITNGSQTGVLQNVGVVLDIRDANGKSANDQFFVQGPIVSGLTSTSGSGALAAGATGRLQYTFIPKTTAAPEAPTVYQFAGTVSYTDNGQSVSMPLLPSPITVYPDAKLVLKYFQQRDVYSDDPFTPEVEPAEPFALGLIVTNEGRGTAKNFSITSAQPKIIDNKKGLLIDFQIIGTQVGTEQLDPSLTVNLGDIEPGESQVAQFVLTSSLQGKFVDYQASYEHASELGGAATSLIDSIEIHELIHVVQADQPDDQLPDFLVNDDGDPDSLPDTLYLSNGTKAPVNLATNVSATLGTLQAQLTAQMPSGWGYLEVADPGAGAKLVRAVRSDGKVLQLSTNVWQTDRSFPNSRTGAVRERRLHLLDFNGTGAYTLFYTTAVAPGTLPPAMQIAQLGPVAPAARANPVDTVDVTFSRLIDPASFTTADVSLSLNGGANLLAGGNFTITPLGEATFRIGGLAPFNAAEGTYVLAVQAGTVHDAEDRAGQGSASAVWAVTTGHLAVLNAGGFDGSTIQGPIASIDVAFTAAVNSSTFTVADLSLTRDGGAELLTSANSITQLSPTTFRIGGLGALTTPSGAYAFTVRASSVSDTAGASGLGSLTGNFVIDRIGPVMESVDEIAPNPRNTPISVLNVTFSKPIAAGTLTSGALKLKRNTLPVSVGPARIVQLDERHFQITSLSDATGLAGQYQLEISADGVRDALGNAGSGAVTRAWKVQLVRPAPPTQLAITPDRGLSPTYHLTNVQGISVTGHVAAGTTRVRATDQTSGAVLGSAAAAGLTFKLPVLLATAGLHDLVLEAIDAAGNTSAPAALRVFLDVSGPTAAIASVAPSPRSTPVSSIAITFSEALNPASFTLADVQLKRDGIALPLAAPVHLVVGAPGAYVLQGLAALTDRPGLYELDVLATGVVDRAGNAGLGTATATWRRLEGDQFQQFSAFAGTYTGLIESADQPVHATSGIASFTLTRLGAFTGTVTYGGLKTTWHGNLDRDGKFTGVFGHGTGAVTVSVTLDTDADANALTGVVTGGQGTAAFVADRLLFSTAAPTPLAGQYVVLLPPAAAQAQPAAPTASGFATVTITPAGKVVVAGELPDGSKFTQGSALGGSDEWPFYITADAGRSSALGQVYCRAVPGVSNMDATLTWFHAARKTPPAFPAAFTAHLALQGALYARPAHGAAVFDFGTPGQHAEMALSGGGLASRLTLPFTFDATGAAVFSSPGAYHPILKLFPVTGLVSGSALLPGDKMPTAFRGVLYPPTHEGSGYFIRLKSGGVLELNPGF